MKCKTCGMEFELLAKNRYVVSVQNMLLGRTVYYNAFDCPICGCQNIVGVVEMNAVENNEAESEGKI